jgi:hypothetical protein
MGGLYNITSGGGGGGSTTTDSTGIDWVDEAAESDSDSDSGGDSGGSSGGDEETAMDQYWDDYGMTEGQEEGVERINEQIENDTNPDGDLDLDPDDDGTVTFSESSNDEAVEAIASDPDRKEGIEEGDTVAITEDGTEDSQVVESSDGSPAVTEAGSEDAGDFTGSGESGNPGYDGGQQQPENGLPEWAQGTTQVAGREVSSKALVAAALAVGGGLVVVRRGD